VQRDPAHQDHQRLTPGFWCFFGSIDQLEAGDISSPLQVKAFGVSPRCTKSGDLSIKVMFCSPSAAKAAIIYNKLKMKKTNFLK
jgi:hypothetical protein